MESLVFQTSPIVTFATNRFINVPVILRYEETNLVEIVKEVGLGYTTQIPIYHPDGTYLAKVTGTRMYPTEQGKMAGLSMEKLSGVTICKRGTQTLFEIYHESGDRFKAYAELYTPDGYFIKFRDQARPEVLDQTGRPLQVGGMTIARNTFQNVGIGVWVKKDGKVLFGVK